MVNNCLSTRAINGIPVFLSCIIVIATVVLWGQLKQQENESISAIINDEYNLVKQSVYSNIRGSTLAVKRMASRWNSQGGIPKEQWVIDAQNYLFDYISVDHIEILDKDYHVQWVVPESNSKLIKILSNIFIRSQQEHLEMSQKYNLTQITPPLTVNDTQKVVILYAPTYKKGQHDGFIAAIYDIETLIANIVPYGFYDNFNITIFDEKKSVYKKRSVDEADSKWKKEGVVAIFNRDWHIAIWPSKQFVENNQSLLPSTVLSCGVLVGLLMGIAVYHLLSSQRKGVLLSHTTSKLEYSENMNLAILEGESDGLITIDMSGVIINANKSCESLFGYEVHELIGQKVNMLMPTPYSKEHDKYLDNYHQSHIKKVIGKGRELIAKHKDGAVFPVWLSISDIKISGETFYSGIIRDITAHKNNEAALKNAMRRNEMLLISVQEGIYGIDLEGKTIFANPAALRMIGYRSDDILGKSIHKLIHHSYEDGTDYPKVDCNIYRTITTGEQITISNEVFWRKDNRPFPVEYTASPIKDEGGKITGAIVVFRDITERKVYEYKLLIAKQNAEESNQLKSEFLANMSHEIRTPMNGVMGMTNLLLGTELTKEQYNYASIVMDSAEALLEIINDILDFSKIEAGKMDLESVPFDLLLLTESVADIIAPKCNEKKIDLVINYSPTTARYVKGDPGRVRQVMMNLLSNAVKFTDEGNVVISIKSEYTKEKKILFNIEVKDSGIGIAEDKLHLIFNKFDQADQSTARKFGGTGLGLSICQQLSAMMGGEVDVDSVYGEGSVFWFSMVLEASNDESLKIPAIMDTSLKGVKALLVAPDKPVLEVINNLLSDLGMVVTTSHIEEDAIEKLEKSVISKNEYDIVIIDQYLEHSSGKDLGVIIHNKSALEHIPMIITTSLPNKGDGKIFKDAGFSGYISKPLHPSETPDIIKTVLNYKNGDHEGHLVTRHTVKEVNKMHGIQNLKINKAQILLAEDNHINQMVATAILEDVGCIVTVAGNGKEALELTKQRPFDLIFMDCQMPEMDGYEASGCIRKHEAEFSLDAVPIIAFTANAMKGDKEKCLDAGMDDHIPKPVKVELVAEILRKYISAKVDS